MKWTHHYGVDSIRVGELLLQVNWSEGGYIATCHPFFTRAPIPGNLDRRKETALEMLRMTLRDHLKKLEGGE